MERVVITGIGAVTPIGNTVQEYWDGLISGKNGIALITHFDAEGYKASVAGEIKDFDAAKYIEKRDLKHMDRYCQYAVAAAAEAMEQAALTEGSFDVFRAGTLIASGIGGIQTLSEEQTKLNERGPRRVSPFCIPMIIGNMASALISMKYGLKGSSFAPVSACASGTHAVGEGMRAIRHGYLDIAVVGGAEASITPVAIAGFANMHALSTTEDPEQACCPFDARRSGFIMGEGAGVLVLESLSHAKARGANIIAEVSGYGTTSDAYHITSPDPTGEGPSRAMQMAIADAGLIPADIDYINAHGTSTPINDKCETDAIKIAFGEYAHKVNISSTKSMTGHLLGAAGAIEAIACALSVQNDIIPPTIHYEQPDEDCDLNYVPNQAVKTTVNAAISNSLGFGGHNATVLIRKYQD
ncbi:MAG: beta-ketoacyl-ACP synthase II [Clostridia bacterium]|nr:beta-ketoacyl-ACP synthase II [Clostridia bacterium]